MMEKTKLAATAYHEAGHAIVTLCLGYPVHHVTIEPGDDYTGVCRSDNPLFDCDLEIDGPGTATDRRVRHRLFAAFAGPLAERRFDPEGFNIEDSSADYEVIFDLVLRLGGGDNNVGEKLEAQADALVLKHWPLIDRAARALLERTTLSGADLAELIDFNQMAANRSVSN